MAALKHTLKREIFLPADERLVDTVHVTKSGKKKKISFLCVVVTTEKPIKVTVYQVKKFGETYKKRATWPLKELKLVDGKDAAKDTAEFELHFDKIYKWVASSISEKNSFISCLWKLSLRYLPRQKPMFKNIPEDLIEEATQKSDVEAVREVGEDSIIEAEDYQEITPREEADLEKLMSQCDYAISNAETFMDQLSRELSVLDGANIHTIMASEQQVVNLMTLLEDAVNEATKIEDKLDVYDKLLQNVRDHMELMEEKDTMIQIQNRNTIRLLEDLDNLISKLDLPHQYQMALLGGDLSIASNVLECTVAAQALQEAMNVKLQPGLNKLAAVTEQQKLFEKLRIKFAQQLSRHLNNLFIHLGNEIGETLSQHAVDLTLPKHHACHRELAPYTDLMLWLKTADKNSFKQLAKIYTSSLNKLYERELREFFESAKQRIVGMGKGQEKKGKGNNSGSGSSTGSQELQSKALGGRLRSQSLIGMDRTDYGSDLDITERHKFDKILENILCELEPLCLAEQSFCLMFFHAGSESLNPQESENSPTADKSSEEVSVSSDGSQKKQSDKQINEEVRKMMGDLFAILEPELQNFISFADKVDTFYNMYMLVRLSQHVMLAQDAGGSFLSIIFANGLVQAKRNFDKFMLSQIKSIEEAKVSKKNRIGIIPFVSNFEDFAQQAEIIFRGSDRRTDLDKWYVKLMNTMIDVIPRVAIEQQKNPIEVVMLENYHNLYSTLSQLKITCLENERRDARQRYSEHLQAYVTAYLGRPLEKLNNFFEGIQSKVAQGVKEEEVGYQLAFSKQELRKVIKEYPGKEVKKGLESLYKKIDKHLCEEENLLQVVWHSMQEEFIRQYKNFESLIERCYPGAMITLEFTMNDILAYFSDIARSH